MKIYGRRAKNLILLTTITLLLSVSLFLAYNQQPILQNTLTIPTNHLSTNTQDSKMGTHLQQLLQTSDPLTEYEMIIFFEKTINYTQGIHLLKELGDFKIISNYTILNGICIKAPIKLAETIAQQNYIRSISHNGKIKLADHQITTNTIQTKDTGVNTAIGASILQNPPYNLNGTGVFVAVLDTGINPHTYLNESRINYSKSFVDEEDTKDLNGHGTAVAGIIGASGGPAMGVAPAVEFLNLKVLNETGEGYENWLYEAINEALSTGNATLPHPRANIISMSLGSYPGNSTDNSSITANDAWLSDVVVVAAAGNEGGYGYFSINSPGLAARIITVGAASGFNYGSIASFSSRGPTDDNRSKPDMVAPGVDLITLSNDGSSTRSFSGTSASTPVVSGAIALLLDENSNVSWVSPNTIKAALMMTAKDLGLNPFSQGAGLINISKAYNYLCDYYIEDNNITPPLIVTPIRAISSPLTLNNITPTVLNLTIIVGNITRNPIINPNFTVTGNASNFLLDIGNITSSPLNNTQVFVQIRFLVPPGESPDHFSGNLELVNNSGGESENVLYIVPLGIYHDPPSWEYLLSFLFVGLDNTVNLLIIGSIAGVATICLVALIAGLRARSRKLEPFPGYYEPGWDEWYPPPPPPDWF
ncbi:MAG: S8 family serine peptidase [Candidatus Jordarchaeum sp.]|uniref:S8 family serine peptidase n=1 Tax=Candidatus Jordarchaeum sp. TaxID=2823881 RepID=UPI0040491CB5